MASLSRWKLNLATAQNICAKYGLPAPQQVLRFDKGMINDVFALDARYVIKINTGDPITPKLAKEKAAYALLRKSDIPVPQVYAYSNAKKLILCEFIIMDYVAGEPLSAVWETLSLPQKQHMLKQLGKLLAHIHLIQFPVFGEVFSHGTFEGHKIYRAYFAHYVCKIVAQLKETRVLSPKKISRVQRFFNTSSLFAEHFTSSLCHGNFVFDNIIVKDGKVQGIIDWEWARAAHNEEEVATVLYHTLKMNSAYIEVFRKGYESVLKLTPEFEKRFYAYNLLYYLRVLPFVPQWTHKPEKQNEYFEKTEKLITKVLS